MSDTIDRRVVEMRFDNKEFESNVQSTMTVLEKLKERLNFKGVEKSMGAAGLSSAVDGVKDRFSAMEVVGMTALINLTNSAMNLGKQLARSLTVDQVRAGFAEYELKMGSIQTIMASTGEDLKTVNGYLNELNTYSDKTIYSFSDMTQSIGKFTNAGVDLDTAVKAIQGISNEAAVSGANAQEASRAMYNFAQALSAGYVKLIDWKSIENANMATKEFKQQLIDTAVEMGNLEKNADGTYTVLTKGANGAFKDTITATKNFNDSLSAAWMTTDVLTTTLGQYADETTDIGKKAFAAAQDIKTFSQLMDTVKESIGSGWAQTFELIFGDLEEAKALWTSVNNVVSDFINKSSDARNNLLKGWKTTKLAFKGYQRLEKETVRLTGVEFLSGRDLLFKSISNTLKGLGSILSSIKLSFSEVFPLPTVERLMDIMAKLYVSTGNFAATMKLLGNNLRPVFASIFTAAKDVLGIVSAIFKEIFGFIDGYGSESALFSIVNVFGLIVSIAAKAVSAVAAFARTSGMFDTLHSVLVVINDILFAISDSIYYVLTKASVSLSDLLGSLSDTREKIDSTMRSAIDSDAIDDLVAKLTSIPSRLVDGVSKALSILSGLFSGAFAYIKGFFSNLGLDTVIDLLVGGSVLLAVKKFKGIIEDLGDTFNTVKEKIFGIIGGEDGGGKGGLFEGIASKIENVLDSLSGSLNKFQETLNTAKLVIISHSLYQLANACKTLSSLSKSQLTNSVTAIGFLIVELSLAARKMKIGGTEGLITLVVALRILAEAVEELSGLPDVDAAVGAIGALLFELVLFMKLLNSKVIKTTAPRIESIAKSLVIIGIALNLLAKPVKEIGSMNLKSLATGLGGVFGILVIMLGFLAAFNTKKFKGIGNKFNEISKSLIIFGVALNVLAAPIKTLGELDSDDMTQGLIGVAGALIIITSFLAALNTKTFKGADKNFKQLAKSLLLLGIGLNLLVIPIAVLGSLDPEAMTNGLLGIAGALLILLGYCKSMDKVGSSAGRMLATSAALLVMSAAIGVIALAVKEMSTVDVGPGLATLFGSLVILAGAMHAMKSSLAGAAAMVVVAGSMYVLAPAIVKLSSVNIKGVLSGLLALGGVMAIFVGFSKLAPKSAGDFVLFAGSILTVAGVMAVLAPAITAISKLDLKGVGAGLLALGGAMAIFLITAKLASGLIVEIFMLSSALGVFGAAVLALGVGLALVVGSIAAVVVGIMKLGEDLIKVFPILAEALAAGFVTFIQGVGESAESIKTACVQIVDMIIEVFVEAIPKLVDAGYQLLINFLTGISSGLPNIIDVATIIIVEFVDGITSKLPALVNAGFNLMISFLHSLADAIAEKGPVIIYAIEDIILAAVQALAQVVPVFGDSAAAAIEGYRKKIREKSGSVGTEAKNVADEASKNLEIKDQSKNANKAIDTLKSGIKKGERPTEIASKAIAKKIDDGLEIPDQYNTGVDGVRGLINGLNGMKDDAYWAGYAVGKASDQGMKDGSGVHSPSWKAFKTGGFIVQGLVNGMKAMSSKAEASATNIATSVIGSYNSAVESFNPFSDISMPSLDMTSVNNQLESINASFTRTDDDLAGVVKKLSSSLDSMTDTMNSRSLNVYNTIDGSTDPSLFADELVRSFKLNARTI